MAGSRKQPSARLLAHVRTALIPYLASGRRLVAAFSGGLDSVVLLDLLERLRDELGLELSALHVNHGLSPHAGDWARFAADWCAARGIPLRVERVQVRNRRELGVEAAAREARYQVFYAQAADYVVLAHHLDDQVETVFLNLLRGSGVRGLAGMPAVRVTHGPHLLRPLLDVPRTTLLDYARRRKLEWVEDESNRDPARPRNFLRHEILPRIETRFPGYREACLRASRHLAEASGLLDELGALDLQHALSDGRLDVAALAALSEARARNLLRVYLQSQGAPLPDTARLNEMLHQLLSAGSAARVAIRWRGFVLRRYRQRVWVELDRKPPPPGWQRVWRGESRLELPELSAVVEFLPASGEGVRLSALEGGQLVLRLRRGGERLRPDCRRPRRSLKNLLQEAGMPPWLRERLPLLCHDETVIAVPGLGVDCAWQAGEGEAGVVVRLLPLYT